MCQVTVLVGKGSMKKEKKNYPSSKESKVSICHLENLAQIFYLMASSSNYWNFKLSIVLKVVFCC